MGFDLKRLKKPGSPLPSCDMKNYDMRELVKDIMVKKDVLNECNCEVALEELRCARR